MLGFVFKRADAKPRRSSRLWRQRLRKLGLAALALALFCGGGVYFHATGSFGRLAEQALARADAAAVRAGFAVGEIVVAGRVNMPQDELAARLSLRHGANIFSADLDALRLAVEESPWVERAAVSRRLPATVVVDVTERVPVALWQYKKEIAVIDARGAVLTRENLDRHGDLLLVVGEGAGENAMALLSLLRAEPAVAGLVASAVRVGGRRWDLHLAGGAVVSLPEEDAAPALAWLARAEETAHVTAAGVRRLDLRVPGRVTAAARARGSI